jgi:anti-sigma regulatory factor (Ser/Thr protein kinase)
MADLAAPAAARAVVGEAIHTWRVPVDPEIAILLTSELMANAVTHGKQDETAFVLLAIACDAAGLRVEVHDASPELPVPNVSLLDEATATTAEEGRGLLLVAALSDEWGFYRTPTGKAVFFRMDLQAPPGFTRFE